MVPHILYLSCLKACFLFYILFIFTFIIIVNSEAELRRRRREERLAGMTQLLQEMKRKQAKSERQNNLRRSLFKPFNIGIGLGVLLIGGGLAYWYCSNKV